MLDLSCFVLVSNMILQSIYFVVVPSSSFYSLRNCTTHYSFWAQLHAFRKILIFLKKTEAVYPLPFQFSFLNVGR